MTAALAGVSRLPTELRVRPIGDADNTLGRHSGLELLQQAGICTGRTLDEDVAKWMTVLGLPDIQISITVDRPRQRSNRLLGPAPAFDPGVDPHTDPIAAYEAVMAFNARRGPRGVVVLCRRGGEWVSAARLWQTRQQPGANDDHAGAAIYDARELPWNRRWNDPRWRNQPSATHIALAATVWPDPDFSPTFRAKAAYLLAARNDDGLTLPTGPTDPLAGELSAMIEADMLNDEIDEVVVSYLGHTPIAEALRAVVGAADAAQFDTINVPAGVLDPILARWQHSGGTTDLVTDLCQIGLSVPQARVVRAAGDAGSARTTVTATEFRVGATTYSPQSVAIADTILGRIAHWQSTSIDGLNWVTIAPGTPYAIDDAVACMCAALPSGANWVSHERTHPIN
ncbi:ESX secretion-associated protein EspG [Mycobacterium attenuatum]|uniref:ESX secretion-associated protein EspG n=1 Tax=Mycobacterium attenuatum TaxID=2341086 RepID=UPI000F2B686A|nr:ESX secretion-associated protein EspG [Mycobacterium attenuatum]VBA62471.1 ESX-5 secretion-associated protein EspG5 [Mycobacterium attenuatum]